MGPVGGSLFGFDDQRGTVGISARSLAMLRYSLTGADDISASVVSANSYILAGRYRRGRITERRVLVLVAQSIETRAVSCYQISFRVVTSEEVLEFQLEVF